MIAALYVDPKGPYANSPGLDPWDAERDARLYPGPHPVIAHPPCERWGRFAKGSPRAQRFTVGDDGGCFAAALLAVRTWGGVLEHPQGTRAFHKFGLPLPTAQRRRSDGWTVPDAWGGRSCHIDQGAYGHKAQKPTWLYAVLPAYPELDWHRTWDQPYRIGGNGYHSKGERARAKASASFVAQLKPDMPAAERHLTPPAFRNALMELVANCTEWQPRRIHVQQPLGCSIWSGPGLGQWPIRHGCPTVARASEAGGRTAMLDFKPFAFGRAPPCINCGRPLEGPTYTGDCLTACDEACYEEAWLKLSPNYRSLGLPELPCPAGHYARDHACPYCRPDLWDCSRGGHVQGPGGLCAAQAWNSCDHEG